MRQIVDQARRVAKRSRRKKIIGDDVNAVLEDRNERPLMVEDYKPKKRLEMGNETIFYEESPIIKVPKNGSEMRNAHFLCLIQNSDPNSRATPGSAHFDHSYLRHFFSLRRMC